MINFSCLTLRKEDIWISRGPIAAVIGVTILNEFVFIYFC